MDLGNLLFSFRGRINRAKYWLAILIYVVASVILSTLGLGFGPDSITFSLLNMIVGIASFISGIAVGVKRLHDRDKSGWWLLLFYVLPGVLITVGVVFGAVAIGLAVDGVTGTSVANLGVAGILALAAFGVMVWAFIELGCLRVTLGPNRYGPDPLAAPVPAPAH